jgi:hypothetical protein
VATLWLAVSYWVFRFLLKLLYAWWTDGDDDDQEENDSAPPAGDLVDSRDVAGGAVWRVLEA